jgi:hypothetical protein
MATEIIVDRGGLDGFDWDSQAVGLYAAAGLMGGSTGGAAKRAGVVPAVGTPLKYILSAGLVGNLKAGVFAIPAPDTSLGVHFAVLPADFLITHTTAHGSQPRTDLIIVELNDIGTSSSTTKFRLLTGTAGAGTPALPTSLGNGAAFTLASVNVPALATTLGTITDARTFTTGAGGLVPVANAAAVTALPVSTPYHDLATDRVGVLRTAGATTLMLEGTAWNEAIKLLTLAQGGLTNTSYATLSTASASFSLSTGGLVLVRATVDTTLAANGYFLARIVGHAASEDRVFDIGTTSRQTVRPSVMFYAPAGTLNLFLEIAVFAPGSGATVNEVKWMVAAQGGVTAL